VPAPLTVVTALVILLPIASVIASVFRPPSPTLAHLAETILASVLLDTALLAAIVGAGCIGVGVTTAWLVTMYAFPGSRQLQWLLLLPLAMPAYIVGYAYSDALAFAGPVQTWIRTTFGLVKGDYWFPETHGLMGAATMFVLVLYPYVYFLARTAFLDQSTTTLEVARTLGAGPWARFWRIAVPAARPAIAVGAALALMETLADFGTVQHFGLHTFTTLIYRTWLGMGDAVGAGQLAAGLLGLVLLLLAVERGARGERRHHRSGSRDSAIVPVVLHGWRAGLAATVCVLPIVLGFVLPVAILVRLHVADGDALFSAAFLRLAGTSIAAAAAAAALVTVLALALAHTVRGTGSGTDRGFVRVACLGYALPGTVLAVGLLGPLGAIDWGIDQAVRAVFGVGVGLMLSGTVVALLLAYVIRFLAVGHGAIEAGYAKITPSIDHAARSLGARPREVLWRIHLPLLRRAGLTAFVLVFADVLKELPATLIVRPFNFDTLAVRVYQLASDERLPQAATGALVIVAVGLLPIVVLTRAITRDARTRS
jgi:iron(III) transport system permease protein